MTSTNSESIWMPFTVDLAQWTMPTNNTDMSAHLCHYLACNTVVGFNSFWEILCPASTNEISKQFDEYGIMSIGTRTFVFFNNFYRLNEEEMKMLDKATEMKKAKSRMARSFHAWVYMNIICQPEKLRRFISYLPTQLQCNFHEGPSFLFEIICNMFVSMVSKATRHLSKSLRRVSSMATASPTNAGNILVDNSGIRYKKEEEISEIQNFLGWAIKELIDDTRMKAIEEKLEGICYDNASLTEKDHCYQFAKSLRILHEEAMTDKEYFCCILQ